ncbi:MAG: hypothetical protein R2827_12495 [Bdellovibrionales bacterium]
MPLDNWADLTSVNSHISVPINAPLKKCDTSSQIKADLKAQIYLNQIVDFITRKNADIFQGYYSRENICIVLSNEAPGMRVINNSGTILVNPKFILSLKNESQIIAVLSHELGHIINNRGRNPSNLHRVLAENLEYRELYDHALFLLQKKNETTYVAAEQLLEQVRRFGDTDLINIIQKAIDNLGYSIASNSSYSSAISAKYQNILIENSSVYIEDVIELLGGQSILENDLVARALENLIAVSGYEENDEISIIFNQLDQLQNSIISNRDVEMLVEIEGDISGFGLFVKSGFKPEKYYERQLEWSQSQFEGYSDAESCLMAIKTGSHIPNKYLNPNPSYPSPCWQIYNIEVLQKNFYKKVAPNILDNQSDEVNFETSFDEIKSELSIFLKR